ncbi:MAG: TIGR03842 family LLM class F420-dependent oxidoreductase [Acidimicrobiales bacterium]
MELGIVLQTDPPVSRLVELARRAEDAGFSHLWTFDSHILWQEPFVVYTRILEATESIIVGPMVTNPLTRDWTVTASLFATLNDMFGNRTVCGIGRGDSAVRVRGGTPSTLGTLEGAIETIRSLTRGEEVELHGRPVRIPWVRDGNLEVWMAAYGPKALDLAGRAADGLILQLADPYLVEWSIRHALESHDASLRADLPFTVCAAAPAYVGDDVAHQRDQVRWFGGMVGNHVADLVRRYGERSGAVPEALTAYIKSRPDYDYAHHGKAGNPSTDFVPDDIVERFCVLGDSARHIEKLEELASYGVDQFALYLMHDAQDATLEAYANEVIPHFA